MVKKILKFLCIAISFIILSVVIYFGVLIYNVYPKKSVSEDIKIYNELVETVNFLPEVGELNNYKEISFKYTGNEGLFSSYSYILKLSYSENDFKTEKIRVEENYYFDEVFSDKIKVDTFNIRVLDLEKYQLDYPKYLAFVGVSESTKEIVYIYYEDQDLDSIEDSWEDFIINECNW